MIRNTIAGICATIATITVVAPAHGDNLPLVHIAPSGKDTADCGPAGNPCLTPPFAMDRVTTGGTLEIADGHYQTVDWHITKSLSIMGAGAENSILDAEGKGRVLFIAEGAAVLIQGLTIRGGKVEGIGNEDVGGGGILNTGHLTLRGVVIEDNQVIAGNGASGSNGSAAAALSGRAAKGRNVRCNLNNKQLKDCNFSPVVGRTGKTGTAGGAGVSGTKGGNAFGGGIYNAGNLLITDVIARRNHAAGGNGGNGGHGGNGGKGQAGGHSGIGSGTLKILFVDTEWCGPWHGGRGGTGGNGGNGGDGGAGGTAFGGAVYSAENARLNVINSRFQLNRADAGSPGTLGRGASGGSPGANGNPGVAKEGCPWPPNWTVPRQPTRYNGRNGTNGSAGAIGLAAGGAVYLEGRVSATSIHGAILAGNTAEVGAGIAQFGEKPLTVVHSTFAGNNSSVIGSSVAGTGSFQLSNSISASPGAPSKKKSFKSLAAAHPKLKNVRQIGSSGLAWDGNLSEGSGGNCLAGWPEEAENPASMPNCQATFVGGAGPDTIFGSEDDDFRPAIDSPAVDMAVPLDTDWLDINGAKRDFEFPSDGKNSQSAADAGAIEGRPLFVQIGKVVPPPVEAAPDGQPFAMPSVQPESAEPYFRWHKPSRQLFLIGELPNRSAVLHWRTSPMPTPEALAAMSEEELKAEKKVTQWVGSIWPGDAPRQATGVPVDLSSARKGGWKANALAMTTTPGTLNGEVFTNDKPGSYALIQFVAVDAKDSEQPVPRYLAIEAFDPAAEAVASQECNIGTPLTHADHHDTAGRNGHVLTPDGPYDAKAHSIAGRTGPIVPVNTGKAALSVAWYRLGALGIAYPDTVFTYDCAWPADAKQLVLADYSRAATPALPPLAEVYHQPDPSLPGYNPNDEHAFVEPLDQGPRLIALQYPNAADPPHVLTRGHADGEWLYSVYRLVPETPEMPLDLRPEIEAGQEVRPPLPISLVGGGRCEETETKGPIYHARNKSLWMKAETAADEVTEVRWYYRPRLSFLALDQLPGEDQEPACVPWLTELSGEAGKAYPLSLTGKWPENADRIPVGKTHLAGIETADSVALLHGRDLGVRLFDPFAERSAPLKALPSLIEADELGFFTAGLPRSLRKRVWFADGALRLKGRRDDRFGSGKHPLLFLNILSEADEEALRGLVDEGANATFNAAVSTLAEQSRAPDAIHSDAIAVGAKAISTGAVTREGHLTLALNDEEGAKGPFGLKVLRVTCSPYAAPVRVFRPTNLFDESQTLRYGADFGGEIDRVRVEWKYRTTAPPAGNGEAQDWRYFDGSARLNDGGNNQGRALLQQTIAAPSDMTLQDLWVLARIKGFEEVCGDEPGPESGQTVGNDTEFAKPAFAEGWLKRVLGQLHAYRGRSDNVLLDEGNLNTSLLTLAGRRYEDGIALDAAPDTLNEVGLIEAYETVLRRAQSLSIDRPSGGYDPDAAPGGGDPLLLASARIAGMYRSLGDEALADFTDPTIPLLSEMSEQISRTSGRHVFEAQTDSPLDEDLSLLRGTSPAFRTPPYYNRLRWNTLGGELATALYGANYGITPDADRPGDRTSFDLLREAQRVYPQGHGDAWGHYLTAQKSYYRLMRHPRFVWPEGRSTIAQSDGDSIEAEFDEERRFADLAAAKARVGHQIARLSYRASWADNSESRLAGFPDNQSVSARNPVTGKTETSPRGWGADDWARKAGQAAYLDWAASAALLAATSPDQPKPADPTNRRNSALAELPRVFHDIQTEMDKASAGRNPLGIASGEIPFGIEPNKLIHEKAGHFEQIADAALAELQTAAAAFQRIDFANKFRRRSAEKEQELRTQIADREDELRERLIEIYGAPYEGDIGKGGAYPSNYRGPDIYHYAVHDENLEQIFGPEYTDANLYMVSFNLHDQAASFLNRNENIFAGNNNGNFDWRLLSDAPNILQAPLNLVVNAVGTKEQYSGQAELRINRNYINRFEEEAKKAQANESRIVHMAFSPELGGFLKPERFKKRRPANGELQYARINFLRELAALRQRTAEYTNDLQLLELHVDKLEKLVEGQETEQQILRRSREKILLLQGATVLFSTKIRGAEMASRVAREQGQAAAEAISTSFGMSNDPGAPLRAAAISTANQAGTVLELGAMGMEMYRDGLGVVREQIELDTQFKLLAGVARDKERLDEAQWILEVALREPVQRDAVVQQYLSVREAEMRYRSALEKGRRLLDQLARVRRDAAASIIQARYRDAVNRALQEENLDTYNRQVDHAARQVYLAARAYDYETIGFGYSREQFNELLRDIMHQRAIGDVDDERTQRGRNNGLAGILAELMHQYSNRFKRQSGFNNATRTELTLSLKNSLYEIGRLKAGTTTENVDTVKARQEARRRATIDWAETLQRARRVDLRKIPEFAACCILPRTMAAGPMPGLVFEFPTHVEIGRNLFGRPLSNDSQAPASAVAHRIHGVAVVLNDYKPDVLQMSPNPQVYFLPVGRDLTESRGGLEKRAWQVRTNVAPIGIAETRRSRPDHTGMPAFAGQEAFQRNPDPYNNELAGRSLENSRWLLIFPAQTFHGGGDRALDILIGVGRDGKARQPKISDIQIHLKIYSYNEG